MRIDPSPPPEILPLSVRLEFVHALLGLLAERAGCRVLHLKGPVAARQLGLRGRRSNDVDVWVAPGDRVELLRALGRMGWVALERTPSTRLIDHATVLTHAGWGCAIDVHHRFPGIGIEPRRAFDLLWSAKEEVPIAGRRLVVPEPSAHTLLLLLHAARGQGDPRAVDDVRQLTSQSAESATEVKAWAARLDCEAALAAVAPGWSDKRGPAYRHWRVRAGEHGALGVQVWLTRILATPGATSKAALLGAALLPDRVVMSRRTGRSLSRSALLGAWARRWADGATQALRALRALPRSAPTTSPDPAALPVAVPEPELGSRPVELLLRRPEVTAAPVGSALAWREAGDITWVADLLELRVVAWTSSARPSRAASGVDDL